MYGDFYRGELYLVSLSTVNAERVYVNAMFRSFAVERSRCENDACRVNPCAYLSSVDISLRVHRFAQWMCFNDRSQLRRSPAPWSIHYDELLCTRCHWEILMSRRVASESTRRKRWLRCNREKAFESTIYRFSSLSRDDYRTTGIRGNNRLSLFRHDRADCSCCWPLSRRL